MNQLNVSQSNQDSAIEPNIENESTAKEDVVFLKSLIVTEENMAIFAEKLNFTREYRLKLLLDKEIHLKEWFPYFFTHPQLILMEFSQANPTVNASVFVNEWPSISQQLRGILANHYKQKTFKTDWSAEIEDVLVVLKLFPTNQVGRNVIASIPNFNKSMNQFIHFEPLNAAPLPGKKGFPHIVACGTSMNDIKYYFIQIENLVFPVSEINLV
ncbi:uncharacterized protein LOC129571243 [Sitodiplosis mosellana]|uniref:uncharacterized protein LOC129571243 n=1 Tax=Sitodiplosis mosellana TaxID=263140 RepID=UPI002444152F|nr:uncharacterized protein LOC129571243 [Sitodiplosis mosellana]